VSRVQLALRVADLEASIAFYTTLLGVEPAKLRPGYANFAVAEPPLKLVLLEGEPGQDTVMDHLGVEVESTEQVTAATERLSALGLFTDVENDTTCCYAVQDKVWVSDPDNAPWEIYTVLADSNVGASTDIAAETEANGGTACCSTIPVSVAEPAAVGTTGTSECC
jgi:catechol 2,3-dioxygenase-like lactoylglutathione lyase family enzyme